jgi:microcin C transport system substrate-binding protein
MHTKVCRGIRIWFFSSWRRCNAQRLWLSAALLLAFGGGAPAAPPGAASPPAANAPASGNTAPAEADLYPLPGWRDRPNPLASPQAVAGGEISIWAGQYPKSFNYYLDNNSFSAELFGAMYETLLGMNPLTLEYEPALAERWTISQDKKTFTFRLNRNARWSDGQPVTAHDVRWTFEALMNPAHLTGPHKVALQTFEVPRVVADDQVCFTAREVHWRNLGAAGGFQILPRHVFRSNDFNKINFEFPAVSGPYRLGEIKEGVFANLERRADWWNRAAPSARGIGNFQTLKFKFFAEQENAFEAFKKGEIDLFAVYMARIWINETGGEKFDRHWIVKQKIYNYNPVGFQGFAMNMRRPPFNDRNVRHAMALLLDREKMNRTLMYSQYFLHRSYFEDLYSATNPCPNECVPFAKEKARRLLAAAGWRVNRESGLLAKNGKPLRFDFLTRDTGADKFLAIYAEDLRDAGIEMKIDHKDWAAWARDMDEFNFDMTWAAWSSAVFKDPEGMWSSKEAGRQGNNITGFIQPAVDALIEKQKTVFDVQTRHAICRDIDRLVAAEYPYVLLWNINYTRLLYWNKFGTPPTVLSKYGNESSAYWHWWFDADSTDDLKDAMKTGSSLPAKKTQIEFDQEFHPQD